MATESVANTPILKSLGDGCRGLFMDLKNDGDPPTKILSLYTRPRKGDIE